MKKILLVTVSIFCFSSQAYALPTCSQYGPSCFAETHGLTSVLAITPLEFPNGDFPFYGFSESEFQSLGLNEYITWNYNGSPMTDIPDSAPSGAPNPMEILAIQQLKSIVDSKFSTPSGTTSQVVLGNGTLGTLPATGSRTFSYPSRTLNSCYQISSSKDADFHYKVDVATGLSLTTGAQGTVTATSYTNSSCSLGAQTLADGTSSQTGTLVVGLGINQTVDVSLDGTLPTGKWLKITTANTVGTPTFTIRSIQSEVIQP